MSTLKTPTVVYLPSFIYDLSQFLFFPLNHTISKACLLQSDKTDWNQKEQLLKSEQKLSKELIEIKNKLLTKPESSFDQATLIALYDALPAVSASNDLVGHSWKGNIVKTRGSLLDLAENVLVKPLTKLGFSWGKRYRTENKGDPLVVSWKEKIYVPIPVWGNVGMTDIRWRQQPTATMNYDHQPWKDYFKLLSDENGNRVLLGVWTYKEIIGGWFTLTDAPEVPTI